MSQKTLYDGAFHKLPLDLKNALIIDKSVFKLWNKLTTLGRNEYICWVISVKKPETRKNHIDRVVTDLLAGKRRPCCWAGCPHRQKSNKD